MAHVATVTIDSTLVDSDLTNFPVYVDLSDLPSVGFWDAVANGGGDIRVFLSDDSTELPREVVSCNTATETGELHFLLDYLSSSSDTDIHIYADGVSSDYAAGATYGRDAVWADYARVYHLRESSGTTATDSSGNADGTYNGTLPDPLGVGQDFNGSSDYVDAGNGALGIASGFTLSAMIASDSVASGVKHICTYDDSVEPTRDRMFQFRIEADELRIIRFNSSNGVLANQVSTTSPVSVGNNHVAFTFDTTNGSVGYVDSVSVVTDSSTTANRDSGAYANLTVGARDSGAGIVEYFDGDIGFLRVRTSGVSADWISAEHENQSSPSTFYSASAAGGGSVSLATNESNQGQTLGQPVLIQNHILSCDSMTQGQSIESPQLIQAHVLALNAMAQGQSLSEPNLVQQNALDTLSSVQNQIVTEPTLVQHHALSTTGIDQSQSSSEPSLTQHNVLSVTASDQSQLIDQPTLSSNGNISPNEYDQGQIIAEPGLTQHYILTTDSVAQAVTLEAALLSVIGSLTVSNASQGQAFDEAVLVQHHVLSVSDESQAQFSGAVSFAQNYVLSVDEVLQAQSFGGVTLTEQALLSLDSLEQVQGSAQITLTEHAVLAVSELSQAQIIDVVLNGGIVVEKVDGVVTIYSAYSGELSLSAGHSGSVTIH